MRFHEAPNDGSHITFNQIMIKSKMKGYKHQQKGYNVSGLLITKL